jgi:site-specific recombinase XerD
MKPTDFALHLTGFLTTYLAAQRYASSNTIRSYRDTFVLLLRYLRDVHDRPAEKVTVATIDAPLVTAFLEHLQTDRHCSPRTCNQRRAAIHSFARYVQGEAPEWKRSSRSAGSRSREARGDRRFLAVGFG